MGELAKGQEVKHRIFKAKIISCTSDAPQCWYKNRVGEVFNVQERQYYQNGKPDGASYWTNSRQGMGWNANIKKEDLEEQLSASSKGKELK